MGHPQARWQIVDKRSGRPVNMNIYLTRRSAVLALAWMRERDVLGDHSQGVHLMLPYLQVRKMPERA